MTRTQRTSSARQGRGLTPRQARFVTEYCKDLDGTAAARRAGYAVRSARFRASKLLADVVVRAAVDAMLAESLSKAKLSVEAVDQKLAAICFSDIRRYFRSDGTLRPIREWPPGAAAAVASLETVERKVGGVRAVIVKLKLSDKIAALTLACRRLGMLRDQVKLSGALTLEQLVMESMKPGPEIGGGGTK